MIRLFMDDLPIRTPTGRGRPRCSRSIAVTTIRVDRRLGRVARGAGELVKCRSEMQMPAR